MIIRFFTLLFLLSISGTSIGQCPIIPTPAEYQETEGSFNLEKQITFNSKGLSRNNIDFLKSQLRQLFTIELIEVKKKGTLQFIQNSNQSAAYEITVGTMIRIDYKTDADAFYAISSLMQLIQGNTNSYKIKHCEISDNPQFEWRGLHLDVARHFFTVDEVKRYIDIMAFYKFNTFHWHLTDDQGWRIEIKKYPKLTEIGAYRDSTIVGHFNANPRVYEKKKYGGFYTQEQIKEVVAYAATKYITVVPEIELPGHARAAIAAYPELSCNETFLPVPGLWGVFDDIFCSKPETIQFLKNVLDEVVELFPSKYIHIGGDEAPKERWNHCEKCLGIMKENNLADAHELQSHFIQQIDAYLTSKGKKIIGWDEILEGGLSPNAAVMSWRGEEGGIEAASQKHEVVMSPTTYCYFDYYQSGNASEPLAIGGFLPLEKVYNYSIIPSEMSTEAKPFVLGGQANLWTEYIPTFDQVEYMVYPRALALIQNLWSENKINYEDFLTVFSTYQEPLLKRMKVNYSHSIYLPELKISRLDSGVKYEFVSVKGEDFKLTKESHVLDVLGSSQEIKGNQFETKRTTPKFNNDYQLKVKSSLLPNEIEYSFINHASLGVPIDLITKPHAKFSNGGDLTLVDGVLGTRPWKGDQWLGFDKELIEIVIDVSKLDTINSITVGFLDAKGSWIYLPDSIRIITEEADGTIGYYEHQKINKEYQVIEIYERVEKLRLLIYPKKEIPQGAEGAGNVPWTFIDEIILK
jgi:hexosaminidase